MGKEACGQCVHYECLPSRPLVIPLLVCRALILLILFHFTEYDIMTVT